MRSSLIGALMLLPSTALAVEFETVMVEMRDGVHLATDVFWPSNGRPTETILIRSPYGREFIPMPAAQQICDGMGYALVVQDTRGRYDSEGVDDVFLSDGWGEHQDGWDTLEWIISQSWSNGEVGMFGASALGITAYLAAGTLHPALVSAHVGISAWNFYSDAGYQGGVFREALVVDWLDGQDASYMLDLYREHPMYDSTWAGLDLRTQADEMTCAFFHWGGWYDIFAEGPVAAFTALQGGGVNGVAGHQQLLMGPWTHVDNGAWALEQGELKYPALSVVPLVYANPFAWFDRTLKGERSTRRDGDRYPVRYYVMGDVDDPVGAGNTWEQATSWPIPTREQRLYLTPDKGLAFDAPTTSEGQVDFVYDPANPSPTIGGRELSLPAGPRDQRPLLERSDVVAFVSEPLEEPLKVVGNVRAGLFVKSTAPDTDFSVRLVDVYPDGRYMLVTDGILKTRYREGFDHEVFLEEGERAALDIELGTTAIVFARGHRVAALVSSSNHRRFAPSQNTDGDVWEEGPGPAATNTVLTNVIDASFLSLPVPEAGASRPAPVEALPSPALVARAQARVARGQALSPAEREALSVELGGWLLQTTADLTARD